ncbi:MAG TPA: alanine--tRNA ligase [Bryobacteraceae bacterium]|nr:alanine--tRNA ligase [Bryobacteraceae bacterium]
MTGSQTRQTFLDFFARRGHRVVRSSSLVPANDPTLLFTNAGMNQFKDVFLGQAKRDYSRATTSQKCVRAGGKHNDLDNVGYTRRHHTFFEMLGNFSFGDYFKRDAIAYAWELITKDYGLPKDRLYFTVFREDDDAEKLWQEVTGMPLSRIFRLDEKDNFWQMGDTGPCGPCSEIHYDFGPDAGPGTFPDDPGERFIEIWNLVFMQFDRDASGKLTPLPRPSIDTGMGLERIACVLQGKLSNYDTDLIRPIIDRAGELLRKNYGDDERTDIALRINADHSRATAFLIHDGVLPSNEGRGYVLRKIMRRAMRNARMIGVSEPYLYKLTGFVAEHMRDAYPEMMESIQRVARVVKDEEHRYATTFQVAEKYFREAIFPAGQFRALQPGEDPQAHPVQPAVQVLPGDVAFKLYDTYGLALDEQIDMAREFGVSVDTPGFDEAMEKQRTRARASWKGAEKAQINPVYQGLPKTEFVGRETLESLAAVTAAFAVADGAEVVLDRTPFYAEAGGQVGDTGVLVNPETGDTAAIVERAYSAAPGKTAHRVKMLTVLKAGDRVIARVDSEARHATMRNHTGTHLLHAALRAVLGTHVKQAGSVVEPSRLRFDFTHYAAMDADEIAEVERLINEEILKNIEVHTDVMDLDHALSTGAMALFGEKYGERVRVVSIDSFSKELCGGTHVARTGDIGICKIVYEGSISAGVRRIEAITGEGALKRFQQVQGDLARIAGALRAPEAELMDHLERSLAREKSLEHELQQMKTQLAQAQAHGLESQAKDVHGIKILTAQVSSLDRSQLRTLVDSLRSKWRRAVVVLASVDGANISIVSGVTKDLTSEVHAGKLVESVAKAVGGRGGGRPDMAEGGGRDHAALPKALDEIRSRLERQLEESWRVRQKNATQEIQH